MARHDVSFNIPQRALGKADVEFQVKRDGIIWVPSPFQMVQ